MPMGFCDDVCNLWIFEFAVRDIEKIKKREEGGGREEFFEVHGGIFRRWILGEFWEKILEIF